MIVTVDYSIERGPDLTEGSKFGMTQLDAIRPWRIDAVCTPQDPDGRNCICRLTRVDIVVDCIVRLNPGKIARSFFDPDPDGPRGYEGRLENGRYVPESPDHYPLDEQSVMVHERSHCKDIAEAVQAHVAAELAQQQAALIAACPCAQRDLCDRALMRMVRDRIRALGLDAYRDLLRDAEEHKTDAATERAARRAQIHDFEHRGDADDEGN